MTASERVAIVIPTYNRLPYVERAIDSVLAQSHQNVHCIVVDDASTDGTPDRLRSRYGSAITLLVNAENRQRGYSRNRGLRASEGDYIGYLDSDDIIYPDAVERRLEIFRQDPDFGGISFGFRSGPPPRHADSRKGPIQPGDTICVDDYLHDRRWLHINAILAPRHVMLEHGLFQEEIHNLEDVELFIRLLVACEARCCGRVVTDVLPDAPHRVRNTWDNVLAQPHIMSTAIERRPDLVAALGVERLRQIRQSEREDLLLALYRTKKFSEYRRCYRDGRVTRTLPHSFRFRRRYAISWLRDALSPKAAA